jgi:hypothetical protein
LVQPLPYHLPMDLVSALGLGFAVVAAWGAWKTVRLTRQNRAEESVRRLVKALLALRDAADALRAATRLDPRLPELRGAFLDAQRQLEMARWLQVSPSPRAINTETNARLDRLQAPSALDWDDLNISLAAQWEAWELLHPPKRRPEWWRSLVGRWLWYRYRRRERKLKASKSPNAGLEPTNIEVPDGRPSPEHSVARGVGTWHL